MAKKASYRGLCMEDVALYLEEKVLVFTDLLKMLDRKREERRSRDKLRKEIKVKEEQKRNGIEGGGG